MDEFHNCAIFSQIFPILDGLIFAIDAHETDLVQVELEIFLESLDVIGSNMPILILYLFSTANCDTDLSKEADKLGLLAKKRSWGVFKVNISTLEGLDLALTWILHHNQKQREELQYHKKSAHA